MNFISQAIYPDLKRLSESGYSGTTLDKWVNGVVVKVTPQKQLTLEQAIKLCQMGEPLDKEVTASQ